MRTSFEGYLTIKNCCKVLTLALFIFTLVGIADSHASEIIFYNDGGIGPESDISTWSGDPGAQFNARYSDPTSPGEDMAFRCSASSSVGWGVQLIGNRNLLDYSQGELRFWVKTPNNLRLEISSGVPARKTRVWLNTTNWNGTNTWQEISIPLTRFTPDFAHIDMPFLVTSEIASTFYVDHVVWYKAAPTILSQPNTRAIIGQTYSYRVEAIDSPGDILTFSLTQKPAAMTINSGTGLIEWLPVLADRGPHPITVKVQDQGGNFATQGYTLNVECFPISVMVPPLRETLIGKDYMQDIQVNMAEQELTFSLLKGPEGMTLESTTGIIHWFPQPQDIGRQLVSLLIHESSGCEITYDYELTVIDPGTAMQYQRSFRLPPYGATSFNFPEEADVDAQGNIFVAELSSIKKLDRDGKQLLVYSGNGEREGEIHELRGIAVGPDGSVYVTSTYTAGFSPRVQKFDNDLNFIKTWDTLNDAGQFDGPQHIAIDAQGFLYITDTERHRVQKFDANGRYISKFGRRGSGNGQFLYPLGIAIDTRGFIYVADLGNYRIQKLNPNGTFVKAWGRQGTGDGEFETGPLGIDVDAQNNVYVTESDRIHKFDSEGNFILGWGGLGIGEGEFNQARGIAVNDEHVLILEEQGHRLQQFTLDGIFEKEWIGLKPSAVTKDSENNFYVMDQMQRVIRKYDSQWNFIKKWGGPGQNPSEFSYANGLAMDSHDILYVADTANHRIQKFDTDGNFLGIVGGPQGSANGNFSSPEDVVIDSQDNFYVVERGNKRVQKFDENATFVKTWSRDFESPSGIGIDSEDNIYVSDFFANLISKFDSNGAFLSQFNAYPNGVAVDQDGFIYVPSNQLEKRIVKFNQLGEFMIAFGETGTGPGQMTWPTRILIDNDGSLYITDPENGCLQKYVPVLPFIRGDVNRDGKHNISDVVLILEFLFLRGEAPNVMDAADVNDDGEVNISDAVSLLFHLFTDEVPQLPAPFPDPGYDPTPDGL